MSASCHSRTQTSTNRYLLRFCWSTIQVHKVMRKIGYARVSSASQNLDRQLHEVFREKASGRALRGRPQLKKAIDALGKGDVLIIAEWDRATRSMQDGVAIIERIHARGAMIKVL